MAIHVHGIELNHVLTFPFRDTTSRKRFLAAAGFSLGGMIVPILPNLFIAGYSMQLLRQAIQKGEVSLPEWTDWNRILVDGLFSAIIGVLYILPGLLLYLLGFVTYMVSILAMIPMTDYSRGDSGLLAFLPMAILFLSLALGSALLIAGAIPLPVALARYADEGGLGAAFQLGEIWRLLKSNPVGYLGAWIVLLGIVYFFYCGFMLAYSTVICCCFGYVLLLVGTVAAGLIWTAMIGLAYRQGKGNTTGT